MLPVALGTPPAWPEGCAPSSCGRKRADHEEGADMAGKKPKQGTEGDETDVKRRMREIDRKGPPKR